MAAILTASFHIVIGISLAFSAIIIPKLESNDTDIHSTTAESSWIASVIVISVPIGCILAGFLMESIGRLNTIKIGLIPCVCGWAAIAMAPNVMTIIFGRMLTGFGCGEFQFDVFPSKLLRYLILLSFSSWHKPCHCLHHRSVSAGPSWLSDLGRTNYRVPGHGACIREGSFYELAGSRMVWHWIHDCINASDSYHCTRITSLARDQGKNRRCSQITRIFVQRIPEARAHGQTTVRDAFADTDPGK